MVASVQATTEVSDKPIKAIPEFPVAPPVPRKGRGAIANPQGRFEKLVREAYDDGWGDAAALSRVGSDNLQGDDQIPPEVPPLRTIVTAETAKSILTRNASPDIPFAVSLNPYRGCEHGCIYCFARPTHSYLGLSPGLDFETRLFAKVNAAELLRVELARPAYRPETIAIGVNTDAYQPIERELKITRAVIEVLHAAKHPFALITKSSLIERDIDLLADLATRNLVRAAVSITTLDHVVARTLEPRAASPTRRLRTIRALADAGIPVSVSVSPVIPFVNDGEMEKILEAAAEAGASGAHYIVLRLPWEVNDVFQQWLQAHFPLRADRVMNRIRDLRGGKDYNADFGKRMRGEGLWADLLKQRFARAAARVGINRERVVLDCSQFVRPVAELKPTPQLGLFG